MVYLPKRALSDDCAHNVARVEELPALDDVVVVLVVIPVVERRLALLLGQARQTRARRSLFLLSPLPLLIVDLKVWGVNVNDKSAGCQTRRALGSAAQQAGGALSGAAPQR